MSRFSQDNLKSLFYRHGDVPDQPERIASLRVPMQVYDAHLKIYRLSLYMAEALKAVLEDGEHQLAMDEAAEIGYRLPDMETFRQELDGYLDFLKSFNPYHVKYVGQDEVHMPYKTARAMQGLVHYNCLMLSRVLSGCFETEYLKHFKTLKEDCIPYAGPTAIQQAFNLIGGLADASAKRERHKVMTIRERALVPPALRPRPA
jgi:hypothetical protein